MGVASVYMTWIVDLWRYTELVSNIHYSSKTTQLWWDEIASISVIRSDFRWILPNQITKNDFNDTNWMNLDI